MKILIRFIILLPFLIITINQWRLENRFETIVIVINHTQAEARAEFAERSVQKLQKEVDRLEGMSIKDYLHHILHI